MTVEEYVVPYSKNKSLQLLLAFVPNMISYSNRYKWNILNEYDAFSLYCLLQPFQQDDRA